MSAYLSRKNTPNDNRFLTRNHRFQKKLAPHFQGLKDKKHQPQILYPAKISFFQKKREIKIFSDEIKLIEFVTSKVTQKERQKKVL